jgi:hypothetical protein
MANEIISYLEMCRREGVGLQRGMNFNLGSNHSVILMSLRPNAPYEDELQDGGTVLVYEGHDEPRSTRVPDPKRVDQPERIPSGTLTQNGRFMKAAQDSKANLRSPERVRVYEKLRRVYGPTMGFSTRSTHGARKATEAMFSNSNWLPSRVRKTSVYPFAQMLQGDESSQLM